MHFIKFSSLFILLSSIFIISHADDNTEADIETTDNNSSEDDTENLTEDYENQQISIGDLLLPKGLTLKDFESGQARTMTESNLWPNGQVYYDMDESVDDELRGIVLEAIDIWKKGTCLKFTEGCQGDACIHVETENTANVANPCYSHVGAIPGGQVLNLGSECQDLKIAIHEIGHAIGFLHEMNRFDRDTSLIINEHNLVPEMKSFFGKLTEDEDTDYDLTSIMHYEGHMGSTDPMVNTLVSLNPHYQHMMGKSKLPSFRDFYRLNQLYSCSSDCPNDDLHCENGGFLSPYRGDGEKCFCVCPPRIEGSSCEEKPEPYEYYDVPSCSQNVTEETVIKTPNYPHLSIPPERCSWWIQAPEGRQVQVEFEDFSFATGNSSCYADRVEIRYQDLYNGDMVCGEQAKGETYTSSSGSFIIIIGGDDKKDRPQDLRGLSAKVTFV